MHKPTVGYCQSMNYITGMLLLVLDKCEEDAFWVLVALIDDGEHSGLIQYDVQIDASRFIHLISI